MSINQEEFKEMLKAKGLKVTNQRLIVLKVLDKHRDIHMAAEDIYKLVKAECPDIGLATVYRTVQLLLEMQLVDRINWMTVVYGMRLGIVDGESKHTHHHLICKDCGKVLSFNDDLLEELENHIEKMTGFRVLDHELKFYGQCKDCAEKSAEKVT